MRAALSEALHVFVETQEHASRQLCEEIEQIVLTEIGCGRQTWVWLAMRRRRWMLVSDILSRSSATGLLGTLPCTLHL